MNEVATRADHIGSAQQAGGLDAVEGSRLLSERSTTVPLSAGNFHNSPSEKFAGVSDAVVA